MKRLMILLLAVLPACGLADDPQNSASEMTDEELLEALGLNGVDKYLCLPDESRVIKFDNDAKEWVFEAEVANRFLIRYYQDTPSWGLRRFGSAPPKERETDFTEGWLCQMTDEDLFCHGGYTLFRMNQISLQFIFSGVTRSDDEQPFLSFVSFGICGPL